MSSRNGLCTLSDATVLLAGCCHVGHKNVNRPHVHGSARTLVVAMQDIALVILVAEVLTKNFLKYLENIGLTKNILRVAKKAVLLKKCHIACKFLGHTSSPLDLWDRVNFLPLTKPNPTDNLG